MVINEAYHLFFIHLNNLYGFLNSQIFPNLIFSFMRSFIVN
ncbi:hypothetical protein BV140_1424 [Haemophilus influenzae]|nr:hypothetical protein BV083_1365 [Haemophilus influenzae]AVI98175.1 hypothetical protein BV085_1362 [Haemophilus influenzae]AVJ07195.1 hypothetical protein BV139_1422 [Haemophilus influenzae]AVJ09029.1 hypothetical protein BV140_1424 [Haemophilus influenzae]